MPARSIVRVLLAVMAMVAMPVPVAAEIEPQAGTVAIAGVVRCVAVMPYAAAMQMPAMTPAAAAIPNLLRQ